MTDATLAILIVLALAIPVAVILCVREHLNDETR